MQESLLVRSHTYPSTQKVKIVDENNEKMVIPGHTNDR